jgi:ABC-type siderophore export system fused ATPase/permease subunit
VTTLDHFITLDIFRSSLPLSRVGLTEWLTLLVMESSTADLVIYSSLVLSLVHMVHEMIPLLPTVRRIEDISEGIIFLVQRVLTFLSIIGNLPQ